MIINTAGATFTGTLPSPGIVRSLGLNVDNVLGGHATSKVDAQLNNTRIFLVAFARSIISRQAAAKTTTTAAH
jgi:hypothetical protein